MSARVEECSEKGDAKLKRGKSSPHILQWWLWSSPCTHPFIVRSFVRPSPLNLRKHPQHHPCWRGSKGNVWASNNLHENQWLMAAMKLSAINWEMETFKKTDKLSICWRRSRMSGWRYKEFHLLVPHGMSINIEAIHFVVITCSGNLVVCTSSPFLLLSLVPWI